MNQPEWIPVSEKKPHIPGAYLTAITSWMGKKIVQTSYWSGSFWGTSFDVTHWAELPKHPEE